MGGAIVPKGKKHRRPFSLHGPRNDRCAIHHERLRVSWGVVNIFIRQVQIFVDKFGQFSRRLRRPKLLLCRRYIHACSRKICTIKLTRSRYCRRGHRPLTSPRASMTHTLRHDHRGCCSTVSTCGSMLKRGAP